MKRNWQQATGLVENDGNEQTIGNERQDRMTRSCRKIVNQPLLSNL